MNDDKTQIAGACVILENILRADGFDVVLLRPEQHEVGLACAVILSHPSYDFVDNSSETYSVPLRVVGVLRDIVASEYGLKGAGQITMFSGGVPAVYVGFCRIDEELDVAEGLTQVERQAR